MISNDRSLNADVVVIGGGPGGSAAATMLARKGVSVCLLERERFPREHVGESLLPASIPVLDELGVLPAVQQAGFLPKWGATMVWGKESAPWSWYFKETNKRYPHSYQVWRPQFDQLLLQNSRNQGVEVREGYQALEVLFQGDRAIGVRFRTEAGLEGIVNARFVVDASGQAGLLSHQLGLRKWDSFFQNLAVYGYFTGSDRLPAPDENNIFIESFAYGWLWNIPLHDGWASVGAVVDSQTGQEGVSTLGLRSFFLEQIAHSPRTASMLEGAELVDGPFIVKDWSYVCDRVVGDGYIIAGDAACFIDPLFSSGVHLALMSGVLAAAYVTTALKDPLMAEAAGQVYWDTYYQEYNHFRELARLFYSSNRTVDSYFWEARRILDADGSVSPRNAFIQAVAGQPPRGYERAVLEQGLLPSEFSAEVGQVESDRDSRLEWFNSAVSSVRSSDDEFPGEQGDLIMDAAPSLVAEAKLERKPVLGNGEFQWGYVLTTPNRLEGTACSDLVAVMLSRIDGRATVREIIDVLSEGTIESVAGQIEGAVLSALRILYVEGAITGLG